MTEQIVATANEILRLTEEQNDKLADDDFDGVVLTLDKRDAAIKKLNRLLDGGKLPPDARTVLEQVLKLSATQMNNTEKRHAELKHEFAEVKQVYESISAYEHSSIDFANMLGFEVDERF